MSPRAEISDQVRRIEKEIAEFGTWDRWVDDFKPRRAALRKILELSESELNDPLIHGRDGFVFSKQFDYLLDDAVPLEIPEKSHTKFTPVFDAICLFRDELRSRGIDLLVVPIPLREEIYLDKLLEGVAPGGFKSPVTKSFVYRLSTLNVETVDLEPAFYNAREAGVQLLYHARDGHWTSRGIQVAADEISMRLYRYPIVQVWRADKPLYRASSVTSRNPGVLAKSIPANALKNVDLAEQWLAYKDSKDAFYQDAEESPILVAGDSMVGHQWAHGANITAALAARVNHPISKVYSGNGGAQVPEMIARMGPEYLKGRAVVVWVLSAHILAQETAWRKIELPK